MPDVIRALGGALTLFDGLELPAEDVVARVREAFEKLHDLPQGLREDAYRELLASDEYRTLKARMDVWCALWFWPPGDESLPTPRTWGELDAQAAATLGRVVAEQRFFHWEIEFPDVFGPVRAGFDAVLGNPPWETVQAESKEFFSRHDALYRTYNKTTALSIQERLFTADRSIAAEWDAYTSSFKAFTNFVKASADPFGVPLGRTSEVLRAAWESLRDDRPHLAHRDQPYRAQGAGKTYTYKLFLEAAHHLLRNGGRLGMLVPSGLYTDAGSTTLRKLFLRRNRWELLFGFENRERIFPIASVFKFNPIVVERGGSTDSVSVAFMRGAVAELERPARHVISLSLDQITRFAPSTWSFMEFKTRRDFDLVDRIYGDREHLGRWLEQRGGVYSQELNMTSDDKFFVSRRVLERRGLVRNGEELRDPRVRARLRQHGLLPLYEGKSFWFYNSYFLSRSSRDSVSLFISVEDARRRVPQTLWSTPRLCMRNIGRSIDQRTFIVGVLPATVHGNSAPTLNNIPLDEILSLKPILASLVADYIVRMKVSANLNWFYLETVPLPSWRQHEELKAVAHDLTWRLTCISHDFGTCAESPILSGRDRMASRLMLDSIVALLFELHPDEMRYIAATFPKYDVDVPAEFRYPQLASAVFDAMCLDGLDGARQAAAELTQQRAAAGFNFGLDELWQPEGGWEAANREARTILNEACLADGA